MAGRGRGKTKEGTNATSALPEIFDECQRSFAAHKAAIKRMKKMLLDDEENFYETFVACVCKVLPTFKREPAVERLIQFIAKFAVSCSQESQNFTARFLKHLVSISDVKDKAIRFRCCQLLGNIMNALDEEAEIDGELWEQILEKILPRTMDKIPTIRAAAVSSLARLQNPLEADDTVTARYLCLLATDSSKDVRKAVLSSIGISRHSVPEILKRTRDIAPEVRKHTFQVLQTKLNMRSLSIQQRVYLLEMGLTDREQAVRKACQEMLRGWFLSASISINDGEPADDSTPQRKTDGPIRFLGCLDVEDFEEQAGKAMNHILQAGLIDSDLHCLASSEANENANEGDEKPWFHIDVVKQEPSPERVFCWLLLCRYLSEKKLPEQLERLLPDLPKFCELLHDCQTEEFVARQLLRVALFYDFSDEAGRRSLSTLLRSLLAAVETPDSIIDDMMTLLSSLHPEGNEYIRLILEIISDLRDPLEELESEEIMAVRKQGEERYEELVAQIEELEARKERYLKKDAHSVKSIVKQIEALEQEAHALEANETLLQDKEDAIMRRCLSITHHLLQHTKRDLKDAGIAGLLHTVIYPSFQSAEVAIRNAAVRCFGLYSLLDEEMAKTHMFIFLEAVENDVDEIKKTAVEVLFDFLLFFRWTPEKLKSVDFSSPQGKKACEEDESDSDDEAEPVSPTVNLFDKVIATLSSFLHEPALKDTVVEGFAKLLLADTFFSTEVLLELIFHYFKPVSEEEEAKSKQLLSVFLPAYAFSSSEHQRSMGNLVLPALQAILTAIQEENDKPSRKKLKQKDSLASLCPASVGQFLIYLADGKHLNQTAKAQQTENLHATLALSLLETVLASPDGVEVKHLPKMLGMLDLSRCVDQEMVKSLRRLQRSALGAVYDKTAKKHIASFGETLLALDKTPNEEPQEPDVQVEAEQEPAERPKRKAATKRKLPPRASSTADSEDSSLEEDEEDEEYDEADQPSQKTTIQQDDRKTAAALPAKRNNPRRGKRTTPSEILTDEIKEDVVQEAEPDAGDSRSNKQSCPAEKPVRKGATNDKAATRREQQKQEKGKTTGRRVAESTESAPKSRSSAQDKATKCKQITDKIHMMLEDDDEPAEAVKENRGKAKPTHSREATKSKSSKRPTSKAEKEAIHRGVLQEIDNLLSESD